MKMPAAGPTLQELLAQCEDDARRLMGEGVALRIAEWRRYAENPAALTVFIRQKLHRRKTFGAEIERRGGMSLERVIVTLPALFEPHDVYEAQRILDSAKI